MSILLVLFSMLICSGFSFPDVRTWTLHEISTALELNQHLELQDGLKRALNKMMYDLYTGNEKEVMANLLSPTGEKKWTIEQLEKAVDDPDTNPSYSTFIRHSLHYIRNKDPEEKVDTAEVRIPALDISVWSIEDVEKALKDPNTTAALIPLLKEAEETIQNAIESGVEKDVATATIVSPVGLVPSEFTMDMVIISWKKENIPKVDCKIHKKIPKLDCLEEN